MMISVIIIYINSYDFSPYFLTNFNDLFRVLDTSFGHLAHVEKTALRAPSFVA